MVDKAAIRELVDDLLHSMRAVHTLGTYRIFSDEYLNHESERLDGLLIEGDGNKRMVEADKIRALFNEVLKELGGYMSMQAVVHGGEWEAVARILKKYRERLDELLDSE